MTRLQYQATKREAAERQFVCDSCGARAIVVLSAIGKSGWHRDSVFRTDDAQSAAFAAAGEELMLDAERVLVLVRCPTCGRRARGAVTWACVRVGFWVALAAGLFALSGGEDGNALWAGIGVAGIAIFFAARELSRFARAGRALFTKVAPGTPPAEPARAKVPRARAVAAPRATVVASASASASASAPAPALPAPPPSPDGGPRLLRD